jgi:adenosylcobinamide-phosphate synthase
VVSAAAIGAGLGVVADRALGEPPLALHPVARFGALMGAFEARWYRDDRARGVVHAMLGAGLGAAAGVALQQFVRPRWAATALAVGIATGGRMLGDVARGIGADLARGDLDAARAGLPSLVGRDPSGLDAAEITRAVVESVAENFADAVAAPVVWGALAGAPGALAHRAINTMDAMVGHRSARYERYGWAAARLDDVANWLPARVGALAVAVARPSRAGAILRIVRRDAGGHPSPNAGVVESAFAAALGVRLGGANRYGDRVEHRALLGDGDPPGPGDIERAVTLLRDASAVLAVGVVTAGVAAGPTGRWLGRRLGRRLSRRALGGRGA